MNTLNTTNSIAYRPLKGAYKIVVALFSPLYCCFRISLLFSLLLNTGCTDRNEVKVIGKNFSDEVSTLQNLVFTFNHSVWPENQLDQWDSTQYVTFEPAIPGKFKWTAPNELVFSPAASLLPATNYQAKLTEAIVIHATQNKAFKIHREPLRFHTPFLELNSVRSWWEIGEQGRPEPRVRVQFNYPVEENTVRDRLKFLMGSRVIEHHYLPSNSTHSVIISLGQGLTDASDKAIKLVLDPGVKIENSSQISQAIIEKELVIPSSNKLKVEEVFTDFYNNKGRMRVFTSQQIIPDLIAQSIKIHPQLPFTVVEEEGGFSVQADFLESETYVLTILPSLKGVLGHTLEEEISQDFYFGKMPESIQFLSSKSVYLSGRGQRNIGVRITNIPTVQVQISKIYENNILHYLANRRYENYSEVGGVWMPDGTFNYWEDYSQLYSDILVNKKVRTDDLPGRGPEKALNLAIPETYGSVKKGVYLVSVASADAMYLAAHKLVAISDIGLIVKQGKNDVWIMANSIHEAKPLKNVEINLISTNNQRMHTLKTGADGIARVNDISELAPGFKLGMVTAHLEEDFNYVVIQDALVETSRFEVEGARKNPIGIEAYIYSERDVYRPGETLNFVSVVRSDDWKVQSDFPIKLKLVSPNGQSFGSWLKETDAQGAIEISVDLPEASLTGRYTLEMYNVNDILLGSTAVNVEEFIPDRIKVELKEGKTRYFRGEKIRIETVATNLFGPPASNRSYEMELQLRKKQFKAQAYREYTFDIPVEERFERVKKQGVTDAQGKAVAEFLISDEYKDIGLLDGRVYVTVFDENGRPVNRLQTFEVATQTTLYGIGIVDRYVGVRAPIRINLLAVDPSGTLKSGERVLAEVVRVTYQTVIEKKNDRMQYTSKRKEEVVFEQTLTLTNGKGAVQYTPTASGEYEIRLRKPQSERYTAQTFYAYGYGYTQYSSFEVSTEGKVLIETDKDTYKPGDKAKVLFKTPFDGQLLITTEQDEVKYHQVISTNNKAAEVTLSISKDHLPNFYVTATLIRPINDEQTPLTVAHGFHPITVASPDRQLQVQIHGQTAVRSKTKQRIKVKTKPHSSVTVAVVDEGILQIRNFATPDIYGYFYRKRALEVTSSNLYAYLFPELHYTVNSSPGGDGTSMERRINPLGNGNRNLVRFWSGLLKADARGEVEYVFDIPQFSGSLRVMAVAFNDHAFGSNSLQMQVVDPLVISAGVPRFASPGDEMDVPITLTNATKGSAKVRVSATVEGPVQIIEHSEQQLSLAGQEEARMQLKLKATEAIGVAKIKIKARAFEEDFEHEYTFTVRPASPLLKVTASGVIAGGEAKELSLQQGFIPSTAEARLVLSKSPLVEGGGKALSTLLGYPHGCLEQILSKAFPQLYFEDLSKAMLKGNLKISRDASDLNPAYNVQQAIRKAESQQLFNGGFSMWPGSVKEDWWVSAYTLHFLDEARRAGFEVNPTIYHAAITYLTNKIGHSQTEPVLAQATDGVREAVQLAPVEAIYSLYVLASVGNPNRAMMNYYKQHQELLTSEMRYLLAGAYYYTGDMASYNALLPSRYEGDERVYRSGYLSPLSSLGLTLNLLLDTDPQNLQIPVLARQLSQGVASKPVLNTQEAAFAVLALGKIARSTNPTNVKATVSSANKVLGEFDGDKEIVLQEGLMDAPIKISVVGEGKLYWFSEVSGVNPDGVYVEEDDGLRVRRYYLDGNGKPLTEFKQNDLIVVKITVSSTRQIDVENVVITDLLPAGFEVENPRLTTTRDLPWLKDASVPEYFDIRDDRIHYFVTATPTLKSYYYQARVTSVGKFTVGPVAADAMYQTHIKSYSGGKKIQVR